MLITAPRYGDIVGPVTGLLEEDDLAVVHDHVGKHACFPRRFALGLMHRATEYLCIPDQCPHVNEEPTPSVSTRRLRSANSDADEVSSMIALCSRTWLMLRSGPTATDQSSAQYTCENGSPHNVTPIELWSDRPRSIFNYQSHHGDRARCITVRQLLCRHAWNHALNFDFAPSLGSCSKRIPLLLPTSATESLF
jgi:hypothetical protein